MIARLHCAYSEDDRGVLGSRATATRARECEQRDERDEEDPTRAHQRTQSAPRYTAGSPGCQRERKRLIGGCRTTSSSSSREKRRAPRTAASFVSTSSSERCERSAAKMMWTTCFRASSVFGEIESTIATGPSNCTSASIDSSSRSSR